MNLDDQELKRCSYASLDLIDVKSYQDLAGVEDEYFAIQNNQSISIFI